MDSIASISDDRSFHYSRLGHLAAASRQRQKAAVQRIVRTLRLDRRLPADISDHEVLEMLAAELEGSAAPAGDAA
jgi:hypothetical protein